MFLDFTQLQHDMAALAGYNDMSKHQYNELHHFTKHRFDTGKDPLKSTSDLITNLLRLSNILMGRELGDSPKKKYHQKHAGISKSEISKTLHILLRKIKKIRQKALLRETLESKIMAFGCCYFFFVCFSFVLIFFFFMLTLTSK